ncbi:hypothetical protein ACS0PU_010433 [Formica fusca]
MDKINGRYRWKGKIVTKSMYEKRLFQLKVEERRKKVLLESQDFQRQEYIETEIQQTNDEEEETSLDGRRIVDLKFLG